MAQTGRSDLQEGDCHGTAEGRARRGVCGHRAGAVLRHDAGRHGRRRGAHRPRHRRRHAGHQGPQDRHHGAKPPLDRARSEKARRRRNRAGAGRAGRRADRGFASRRDGTPRAWPRGLPGAKPPSGLWPHDRLGPGRHSGPCGGPRPQLHRALRRVASDGRSGQAALSAAQPGRRFRRWRHAARLRHRLRARRGKEFG